jgi:hypothetical protein
MNYRFIVASFVLIFGLSQMSHGQSKLSSYQRFRLQDYFGDPNLVSHEKRDLVVYRVGHHNPKHRLFIQGGLHGNEELTPIFVIWILERYHKGQSLLNQLAKDDVAIDFFPFSNPDGSFARQRLNSNGVNLNRNFGVLWGEAEEPAGERPFSEPETAAIKRLFDTFKYTASVDVHGYVPWIFAPSPMEQKLSSNRFSFEISAYQNWLAALKQLLPTLGNPYEIKKPSELKHGGSFEDWAYWQGGSFAFCLELENDTIRPKSLFSLVDKSRLVLPDHAEFYRYERYIFQAFNKAIRLKDQQRLLAAN